MRWYEYKMEVDDLHASDDLKAKLLALQANAAETPGAKSIAMPALPDPQNQKKPSASPPGALPSWPPAWQSAGSACTVRVCL